MVFTANAKIIEPDELKEIIDEEYTNPTVERLMFIETKAKDDMPGKIFPCYIEAYGMEKGSAVKVNPELIFRLTIVQSSGGEFSMVRVAVPASELGVTKRIWDKPPTKWLRDYFPFLEEGVH